MSLRPARDALITLLFLWNGQVQAGIPSSEREALLALYAATGGEHWHVNTHWLGAPGTECTWYGVSCDAEHATVVGLNLAANHLKGRLPLTLKTLIHLTQADFRYNGVYTDDQGLVDFLDAGGPPGSLLDTQTLDAEQLGIDAVAETSVRLHWAGSFYDAAGGYEVYVSTDKSTGDILIAELAGKSQTAVELTTLTPCTQYHARVRSYTDAHQYNAHRILSDGRRGGVVSFIPNWQAGCLPDLMGTDIYIELYEDPLKESTTVTVRVDQNEPLVFVMSTIGNVLPLPNIQAGHSLVVVSNSMVVINGESYSPDKSDPDSAVMITADSGFSVLQPESFNVLSYDNAGGNEALVFDQGYVAITSGMETYELAEDTPVDTRITSVNVKFIGRDAFVGNLSYSITAGNEDGRFAIDRKSGEVVLVRPLDFEDTAQYQLVISATDGVADYQGTLTINITDVAEEPSAGGCSLRPGAAFDPLWGVFLITALLYGWRRSTALS